MDGLHKFPRLDHAIGQIQEHCLGRSQNPEEEASAAVAMFGRLVSVLFPVLGQAGSLALFRRSLHLTDQAFPCYQEMRIVEEGALLNTVESYLRRHPQIARDAATALLKNFVELLATFVGEGLTRQLLQDAWPAIVSVKPEETPQ
ncbi:MAG: hypothetical protein NDI90_19390 [Nitrospira sp. BO4]|nr:hypothetical protein [Nitrospira sp. BO4]